MPKETLLEKAKKVKMNSKPLPITNEHIELGLAWLRDEIAMIQISKVVGCTRANVGYRVAGWLREAYRQGKLQIK